MSTISNIGNDSDGRRELAMDWNPKIPYLPFSWKQIGIAILIILICYLFRKIFTKYIFRIVLKVSNKVNNDFVTNILLAFEKPLRIFIAFIGFYVAFRYLPFPEKYDAVAIKVLRSFIVILVSWGLYNLSATSSFVITKLGKRFKIEEDDVLLPFLSKILRFAIVAMGIFIVADLWGYNVDGFIAGLGLGGLAFALAAQDSISNFFGGVVIITEKPFGIGDWIQTPTVEGTVEDISFRSTRIRTFAQSLVTVPNSTLANEAITNWSKMGKRQIKFNLEIKHSTPREKVKRVVERIDDFLRNHDEIHQETIMVRFNEFKANGLAIFFYFFTKTTVWSEYLRVREEVNLKILQILEEEDVSLAPSTRIYMEEEREMKDEKQKN